ncbi:MAG: thioredoxin [Planctomycetota bacterium]
MANSPHVVDVDTRNFTAEVLERSQEVPVLVDFWAEWCGPCRTLGPILERLADEMGGAFRLAKIDTDRQPEIAQSLGIQSLPTVKLVHRGALVDEFMGALPEAQVRAFLAHHGIRKQGGLLENVEAARARGDLEGAEKQLRDHLAGDAAEPPREEVELALAEVLAEKGDAVGARAAYDALVPSMQDSERGRALRAGLALAADRASDDDLRRLALEATQRPDDLALRIRYGKALASAGKHEAGLRVLMDTVYADRDFDEQAARKAMLEIFDALGPEHDLVADYRRELQMALFV